MAADASLLPLGVDLFWFKAIHHTGNVTLLPQTIHCPIKPKPLLQPESKISFMATADRNEIFTSSKSPISGWGELVHYE